MAVMHRLFIFHAHKNKTSAKKKRRQPFLRRAAGAVAVPSNVKVQTVLEDRGFERIRMGNVLLSTGFFGTAVISKQVSGAKFITRRISSGITYYYTPFSLSDSQMPPAPQCVPAPSPSPLSVSDSSSPLLSDSPPHTTVSSQNQSDSASASRPLLLFLSWLGAQPGAVAKYRDLYLDRGMDVLVVRSSVMHFLWPRWGLDYGLEVLTVLEEPQFSGRVVLVHASSIGGFTFSQILIHIARRQKEHAGLAQRVVGQIYDSLVVGTLEHMAIGLGKTLVPRLEGFVKNTAMLYFWLFKSHTADFYENSIQVFRNSPITAPALFFFSENDALCDPVVMDKCINYWRKRGVTVVDKKWKESIHAAHMRCHPEDYLSTLEKFLNSLHISCISMQTAGGVNV